MIDTKSRFHIATAAALLAGMATLSACGSDPVTRTTTSEQVTTTTPAPAVATTTTTTQHNFQQQ